MTPEQRILASWHDNAAPWARLIQRQGIASRRISDPAIEHAILTHQPGRVLDVGCGEGWLCRRLAEQGMHTTGIDAIESLVNNARQQHPQGDYRCLAFGELENGLSESFDMAVCNFSLFGEQSVEQLLSALQTRLSPTGILLVQTLHPLMACDGDYRNGWRETRWPDSSDDFGAAPPWYFRTLENWLALFQQLDYRVNLEEPLDPQQKLPVSVIFHASPDQGASE
jgi:2-polyprenyl-3-methyl-5-hydroxy-6-metoxy-1,4-benzoquinol methylase